VFKGTETKKLVLISTLCCLLLIASLSVYLILSSRSSLRKQTDQMKTAMAEEIAGHLQDAYASMADYLKNSEGIEFGASVAEMMRDTQSIYDFFTTSIIRSYDADFVLLYSGDDLVASATKPGIELPSDVRPDIARGKEYVILNELGGRQGTFLVVDRPGILPGDEAIFAIDNTAQIETIRQAYENEKSSAIKQQVIGVAILFLLLLALSLLIIYLAISRLLGRPMSRLSREAREIIDGRSTVEEEVREGSIFANLQRLLNSGRVILGKGGAGEGTGGGSAAGDKPVEQKAANKVMAVWAGVTTLIFLASSVILLITSIALMNSKAEAILDKVDQEMAAYYTRCYDSIIDYTLSNPSIYVGNELWDPNATIDRQASIERLAHLVQAVFDCDAAASYIEPGGVGKYFTAVKEGEQLKEPKPTRMGDSITIYEDYNEQGDLVMVMMDTTDYPGMGDNQFAYYVVDVTPQANVLEDLYQSGSSSLLSSQFWLSLLFLVLCLAISPLAMAWATMHYITKPILELDAVSERLMEGDLDVEITVDEKGSFADIQRLLVRARDLLKSMALME
jgi:methyl-accepting chemotaxis protein